MDHIIVEGAPVSTDHYSGGECVSSTRTFEDVSPIDETILGRFADIIEAHIEYLAADWVNCFFVRDLGAPFGGEGAIWNWARGWQVKF